MPLQTPGGDYVEAIRRSTWERAKKHPLLAGVTEDGDFGVDKVMLVFPPETYRRIGDAIVWARNLAQLKGEPFPYGMDDVLVQLMDMADRADRNDVR